jgi:hypothetical protein
MAIKNMNVLINKSILQYFWLPSGTMYLHLSDFIYIYIYIYMANLFLKILKAPLLDSPALFSPGCQNSSIKIIINFFK